MAMTVYDFESPKRLGALSLCRGPLVALSKSHWALRGVTMGCPGALDVWCHFIGHHLVENGHRLLPSLTLSTC